MDSDGGRQERVRGSNTESAVETPKDNSSVTKETIEKVNDLIKKAKSEEKHNINLAIKNYQEATMLLPGVAQLHSNLGNLFLAKKDFKSASACYEKALNINPNYVTAIYNLGLAQKGEGETDKAIKSFAKIVKQNNRDDRALLQLAVALNEKGLIEAAKKCLHDIAKRNDNEDIAMMALSNLGGIYSEEQEFEESIELLEKAILVRQDMPSLFHNLGHAYGRSGEINKAIYFYNKALELNPNAASSKMNLAMTYLISGDFTRGWELYNERFKVSEVKLVGPKPLCKQWQDENLDSITDILFYSEQGMGDTLQFMRYAKAFKAKGINVAIAAQPKLHQIIQEANIFSAILTPKQASKIQNGLWVPLLSVPKFLNISPDNPITNEPYLRTKPDLVIKWRDLLSTERMPIIGINWQGNPKAEKTGLKGRSLALERFSTIASNGNIKLLSLQKGFGSEQLQTCSFKSSFVRCQDKVNETWDFLETAAIIANCDLIITSDTSVAHLAGGMGKRTWLLLKKVPDWRWGLESERTFWYPAMKLYRQTKLGDWDSVLKEVANDLFLEFPNRGTSPLKRVLPVIDYFSNQVKNNPQDAHNHNNLGNILQEYGQLDQAVISYNKAVNLSPGFSEAYNNLGLALHKKGDLDAAFNSLQTSIKLRPTFAGAFNNLGNLYKDKGHFNLAIKSYKKSIQLKPSFAEAHFNLALTTLLINKYQDGWREYEWRDKWKQSTCHPYTIPKCPRNEEIEVPSESSKLLLVCEQGLGDTIQFMRYAFELARRGLDISLCAQAKLHPLINYSCSEIKLLSIDEAKQTDKGTWLPLLSLPQLLCISPGNPLITNPYIHTNEELRLKWKNLIQKEDLPVIGINWQGNPKAEQYGLKGRSFPLEALAPVAQLFEAKLLSLQKGFGTEQLITCSFREDFVKCQNMVDQTWNFLETAAIISNCDLIITNDTAIAHLAGGMGKPTWLLLQKIPDWRWGLESKTSFWYPSMRLFRQSKLEDWDDVVENVVHELDSLYTRKIN